jgi:hypothetical protein
MTRRDKTGQGLGRDRLKLRLNVERWTHVECYFSTGEANTQHASFV